MSDEPNPCKKPCKGILKTSSSFDHTGAGAAGNRKSAKFDELNVLQTYHPPDKDYGHMKVEEPKTPYNYVDTTEVDALDAELLAEKLRVAAAASSESEDDEDDEPPETDEEKTKRLEFERRRKAHYNEYQAVKLARKLLEQDEDEADEDDTTADNKSKYQKMEVEDNKEPADK